MPLINKGMYSQQNFSGSDSGSDFRNPKSIWRNTVRIKPGEHAVLRFITDFKNGDMSQFHGIPGMTQKGQAFTTYEYCSKKNCNETGPIVNVPCEHCASADERIAKTTSRYLTWVFHYGTFHVEANPFLFTPDGQEREGQVAWDQMQKGNRTFYRETVKKPQLLNTSFTLFKNVEEKYERYSTLLDRTFDYSSSRPTNITQYSIELSDTTVTTDYAQEILDMSNDLPDLELIAAKLITEVDLFSLDEPVTVPADPQKYENAFANMANIAEDAEDDGGL
tara:strand:+ start:619 stop:1452 length:834 start_codon:yes stop_codon:yes gene_type:complete